MQGQGTSSDVRGQDIHRGYSNAAEGVNRSIKPMNKSHSCVFPSSSERSVLIIMVDRYSAK